MGLQNPPASELIVQIEWRGCRSRIHNLSKGVHRNCTSKQHIQMDGTISWNEEFDHVCKMKMMKNGSLRCWVINLEVHEFGQNLDRRASLLAKVSMDIAEYASPITTSEETIRIPINCNIRGYTDVPALTVKLKLSEHQRNQSTVHPLAQALMIPSLSCMRPQQQSNRFQNLKPEIENDDARDSKFSPNQPTSELSSEEEPEFNYGKMAAVNQLASSVTGMLEYSKPENTENLRATADQPLQQPSLVRLLSCNKGKLSFRAIHHPKGTPLINKAYGENGGDDIDRDRRRQSGTHFEITSQVQPGERFQASGFEDDNQFEVGAWEKRHVISRDGKMELVTEIFLASIDQRSEKASGGSACTVLVAIIADWLHRNPKTLPLRCQFDDLIREGSSEWRKLCANENHKEKFTDQHFDLETILEAKVRPLLVVSERSYIGFFVLDDMPKNFEFLQEAMSFDNIWDELLSSAASEEQIYIISWNDHFFVLKVESKAIYIIDTLGERLCEGCNQAYIIKFNSESVLYRLQPEPSNQKVESKENTDSSSNGARPDVDDGSFRDIVSQGKISCKEFIKGFLAALPLRELQDDIKRGLIGKAPLHQRMQIEFHHTAPFNDTS
ncbi:uncharacterized protein LOC131254235 [Magnolia sinica]|uniref:uncharacterized protein LOC131254235 n=1 Tax=Magnolia sinica TaxID=86752 RepID=UPI0026590CEA|nr:uncharacterized protein LOC131254235 [Magnolia sinica]